MKTKILGGLTAFALALMATPIFAAADQDVLDAASSTAATLKDNAMGAVTANLPVLIITGVLIVSVLIIWRLFKRFTGR